MSKRIVHVVGTGTIGEPLIGILSTFREPFGIDEVTLKGDREVIGMCFTPQDSNSLLSSMSAAFWFLYPDSYEENLTPLKPYFFKEI